MCRNIPDQGVDLDGVDVIELLEGSLDLGLVGLDVDNEDEGVVLLDLLHGTLSVERVDDDLVLIKAGLVLNGLAEVLGVPGKSEGLRAAEGGRGSDLGLLVGVNLVEDSMVSENSDARRFVSRHSPLSKLTPFSADLAAALACLEPALPLEVPDHENDASAIALSAMKELAKSAAAGMHRIVA